MFEKLINKSKIMVLGYLIHQGYSYTYITQSLVAVRTNHSKYYLKFIGGKLKKISKIA